MANEAWQISSPSVLTLNSSSPISKPGRHQALVRIHAVSLNSRAILVLDHSTTYPLSAKKDLIPCSDTAGIVEEAGEGSLWTKGDRVIPVPNTWLDGDNRNYKFQETAGGGEKDGFFAQWIVQDDALLVKAPEHLSLVEAATLFTAGLTAFRALFFGPAVTEPGTTLLTQGTGGVSCFAMQLASAAGATVIATSSSDEKLVIAKRLGATHVINYHTTPAWADEALRFTQGTGVDHVFDVGGAGTIEQSLQATRQAGQVTVVGILTESRPADLIPAILFGNKQISGQLGAGNRVMFQRMVEFIADHDIHPVIAKTFEFNEAREAFEYARNLSDVGKVVIKC